MTHYLPRSFWKDHPADGSAPVLFLYINVTVDDAAAPRGPTITRGMHAGAAPTFFAWMKALRLQL